MQKNKEQTNARLYVGETDLFNVYGQHGGCRGRVERGDLLQIPSRA